MTGPEVTQPDPDGGVEMTDGEWAEFRAGVGVTPSPETAEKLGVEVAAAVERGVKAFMWADETGTAGETVTGILAAALDVPQMAAAFVDHLNTDTPPGDPETLGLRRLRPRASHGRPGRRPGPAGRACDPPRRADPCRTDRGGLMTHDEVTAAMKAEDAWVEKAARGWWDWGATMRKATGNGREWDELNEDERALVRSRVRTALAPVLPEIQAQALRDAAGEMEAEYEGRTANSGAYGQKKIRAALLMGAGMVRDRAARLTTTTEGPTDV